MGNSMNAADAPKPAKMGRPFADPPVKPVLVMLDAASIERAKLLGTGNVSRGVREALKRARLPFEETPI